jgi:hypothetical protein
MYFLPQTIHYFKTLAKSSLAMVWTTPSQLVLSCPRTMKERPAPILLFAIEKSLLGRYRIQRLGRVANHLDAPHFELLD